MKLWSANGRRVRFFVARATRTSGRIARPGTKAEGRKLRIEIARHVASGSKAGTGADSSPGSLAFEVRCSTLATGMNLADKVAFESARPPRTVSISRARTGEGRKRSAARSARQSGRVVPRRGRRPAPCVGRAAGPAPKRRRDRSSSVSDKPNSSSLCAFGLAPATGHGGTRAFNQSQLSRAYRSFIRPILKGNEGSTAGNPRAAIRKRSKRGRSTPAS